jgi:hypothetical protein
MLLVVKTLMDETSGWISLPLEMVGVEAEVVVVVVVGVEVLVVAVEGLEVAEEDTMVAGYVLLIIQPAKL